MRKIFPPIVKIMMVKDGVAKEDYTKAEIGVFSFVIIDTEA